MLRRLAPLALLAAAFGSATAAAPASAQGSCADVLEVAGTPLLGLRIADERLLPRVTGPHPAIRPACGDARNRAVSVLRLDGVPPRIAVFDRQRRTLYYTRDTLTQIAGHPLQAAVHGARPLERSGPCRRDRTPLQTRAVEVRERAIRVDLGGGADVGVDAETRITNRAVTTPVRPGQRLSLRTSACEGRQVADRIAFVGAPPPEGAGGGDEDATSPYVIPAVLLGAGTVFVLLVGLGLLIPRARRRPPA